MPSAGTTPQRRVTRSQSRELDDPNYGKQSSSKTVQRTGVQGRAQLKHLPPVIEQSPISSHHTPTSRVSSSVVPNTPTHEEGNTNISGTTFLAHESDHDSDSGSEDGGIDAIDMADELPDLQQASTRLLELVGTNSSDAKGICEVAKRIANPAHADNKRFKRVYKKLADSMKVFTNESYIDAARVSDLIPSVTTEDAPDPWDPRPYLYRANYAWLALTTLSAAIGSQTQVQAIENLDKQFPAPFMSQMIRPKQKLTGGGSSAIRATVDLALEIRTQYFISQLEKRQGEKGFDAQSILKEIFYHDPARDAGSLRGFNLPATFEDENGFLPDSLHDEVSVRIDELETSLFDDDDNLDLHGLKTIFSWRRFCLRVARFVQLREQEFKATIASQPKIDDVQVLVVNAIHRRADPNAVESPDHATLVNSYHEGPSTTLNEISVERPEDGEEVEIEESSSEDLARPEETHEEPVIEQSAPKPSPQRVPSRRKSNKGIWRTADAMDFLAKTLNTTRQADSATLEPQPVNSEKGKAAVIPDSPRGVSVTADRDEIAGTPEPEPSTNQPASPQHTGSSTQDDQPTFNPLDDDLVFDQPHEAVMSASPRGSERINRVSHYPGRFFDSPSAARAKPSSPRRSIFDRQATASRVVFSPGGSEESQSGESPREPAKRPSMPPPPTSQGPSRKRGRGDSDDEASDDDDFDRDTRDHNISQRRSQIPEQARPSEKRQRVSNEEPSPAGQLQEDLAASQQQSQVTSLVVPNTAPAPRESRWHAENSISRASHPPPAIHTAGRRRWSDEEDDRLIMLIARHGTQWATIQRQDQICPTTDGGPQLSGRTQVNMKDRARTIKQKYKRYIHQDSLPIVHVTNIII
ncbi:uncharacterized protein N7496_004905 [Penicillium cataractarum]|uniref:Myb-like domain-containing protein n=1 Tax=Penicillium cataractarum TaxID=2100454 RepID=A0A9W9SF54_9EURO|nr:uncharacterized protein N7496_004905 [Penicillium cataractarum]KAJ5377496.1 hypothetical protein N7496_004905 [Penicillium cataractarum]